MPEERDTKKINFTKDIKRIKNGLSSAIFSYCYRAMDVYFFAYETNRNGPLLKRFEAYVHRVENEKDTATIKNKITVEYHDAINSFFSPEIIKNWFQMVLAFGDVVIDDYSTALELSKKHPELSQELSKHLKPYEFSQIFRAKIFNYQIQFKTELEDINKRYANILHAINVMEKKNEALIKNPKGLKAGLIIGSVIAPGIGTMLGGLIGNSISGESQEDSFLAFWNECEAYTQSIHSFFKKFLGSLDELKSIIDDSVQKIFDLDRRIYFEFKDKTQDLDHFFQEHYTRQILEMEEDFKKKVDVDSDDSITWNEMIDRTSKDIEESKKYFEQMEAA